ncbi:hypothetical protein EW146_g5809 [Bondarzewia mesenterica]|uniref:RING-type domain-containing protein n=1 Tax=Bondarzewia mesenterica TaxID=1095465 RepID=A0A4S4LSF1_9AGAM|nr:hypothetical protein EW146_g5809 [Bondarzewia mesenterica]
MDNNHNHQHPAGFLSNIFSFDAQNAIHNLLSGTVPQPQASSATDIGSQAAPDRNNDTPAQEASPHTSASSHYLFSQVHPTFQAESSHDLDIDADMPPLIPSAPTPSEMIDLDDVAMPELQPLPQPAHNAFELGNEAEDAHSEGHGSMPDLESVSNSSEEGHNSLSDGGSSERDALDVEMNLGDNDGDWTDDDSDVSMSMPTLQPFPSSDRHVTVEDVPEDDDRPHNADTTRQGSVPPQSAESQPSHTTHTHDQRDEHHHRHQVPPRRAPRMRSHTFTTGQGSLPPFRTLFGPLFANAMAQQQGTAGTTPVHQGANPDPQPNGSAANPSANLPRSVPGIPSMTITVEVPVFQVPLNQPANAAAAPQPPNAPAAPQPQQQGPLPGPPPGFDFRFYGRQDGATDIGGGFPGDFMTFNELLQLLGLGQGAFFNMMPEDDREDPERAKRLVAGLEEVPMGLVKRMEHLDTEGGEGQGCAICWERLSGEEDHQENSWNTPDAHLAAEFEHDVSSPALISEQHPSSTEIQNVEPASTLPNIVALPCSHVFHSACLIPWFSRPRQTTCPACRFNIDPDNLTYTPRSRRRNSAPPTGQQQEQQTTGAAGSQATQPIGPQATNTLASEPTGPVPQQQVPPPSIFEFGIMHPFPPEHTNAPPQAPADVPPAGFPPQQQMPLPPMFQFGHLPLPIPVHIPQPQPQSQNQTQQQPQSGPAPPPPPFPPSLNDFIPFQPMNVGPDGAWFSWSGTIPIGHPPNNTTNTANQNATGGQGHGSNQSQSPPEKRPWTPPPAPGPTLRQRVEQRERDASWRCDDISCGVGPSDDDPLPVAIVSENGRKRIVLKPFNQEGDRVCAHQFHPACLVSAERVAGWGHEEDEEVIQAEKNAGEMAVHQVEVSCPVCRAVGAVSSEEWEEGRRALA